MSKDFFQVVFTGTLLEGFEPENVKAAMSKAFRLSSENVESIFSAPRTTLKKQVSEVEAQRYQQALAAMGLATDIEAMPHDNAEPESPTENPAVQAAAVTPAVSDQDEDAQPLTHEPVINSAAPNVAVPSVSASEPQRLPFAFLGNGTEYFKIWIANIFLIIVTLGFYSPWAKVRNKQYFYGNTRLDGASFEYLANPIQILKGRIIAVAVFVVYTLLAEFVPVMAIILPLILLIFIPWIVVRGLAFNARMTAYRNIRFDFQGTAGGAAKVLIGWQILGILSLGILFPIAFYKQHKFMIENHRYGTARFDFNYKISEFYILFLAVYAIVLGGFFIAGLAMVLHPVVGGILMAVSYLAAMGFFTTRLTNMLYGGASLGQNRFTASYELVSYCKLIAVNTVLTLLTLGLYLPWAMVRVAHYRAEHIVFVAHEDMNAFVAGEAKATNALGEELGDVFDVDMAII